MHKSLFFLSRPLISLILLLVFFVAINSFASLSLRHLKIDLTEQKLFTLSDGSKTILRSLREPVRLKFYISRQAANDFPQIQARAQYVRDMLEEMVRVADGMIELEIHDPPAFSELEEEIIAKGLVGRNTPTNDTIYFGLVGTNIINTVEVIPYFAAEREAYLEYDLARLIANLDTPKKPVLGVMSNLPLDTGTGGLMAAMRGQSQPFLIYQELTDRFNVEFLSPRTQTIPSYIQLLLIAHPRPLSDELRLSIDQFVMQGGRLIIFIDPQSEVSLTAGANGQPLPGATPQSNLPQLLAAWGVKMDDDLIIADAKRAQEVFAGRGRQKLVDYILWQGLIAEDMNSEDLVTGNIDQLNIGTAGYLQILPHATAEVTILASSSDEAMLLPREQVLKSPSPEKLLAEFEATKKRYPIAIRLRGKLNSAFRETATHTSTDNGNVIIVSDSDFFDDRFWVSEETYLGQRFGVPIADNAKFLLNAAENLIGADNLIGLRGREPAARPFTHFLEIQRQADQKYLAEQQALRQRVQTAQDELSHIEARGAAQEDVQDASKKYRTELLHARRALRAVEDNLRRDIEVLETYLQWLNIVTMPVLIILFALIISIIRRRKRLATQRAGGFKVVNS